MYATFAGPSVSPNDDADDGSPSASVVRSPVLRSMREIRPVVVVAGRNMGVGGPCGASKPSGTAPDSATTSAPSGANVKPRGLIRPVATAVAFDGKLRTAAWVLAGSAQARPSTATRSRL